MISCQTDDKNHLGTYKTVWYSVDKNQMCLTLILVFTCVGCSLANMYITRETVQSKFCFLIIIMPPIGVTFISQILVSLCFIKGYSVIFLHFLAHWAVCRMSYYHHLMSVVVVHNFLNISSETTEWIWMKRHDCSLSILTK